MGQEESTAVVDDSVPPHTLSARSLAAVADYIKSGRAKRIVVLTGAGISTAAGIPDFRSPKTGLYNNLARLNLPYAEAVFDIGYFREHPEPFYVLARELYPGKFFPTVSHAFIALLAQKGLLHMLFTQNIDCLERRAGVPDDKVVEAHGSFATQRCIECKKEYPDDVMKDHVMRGQVPRCADLSCKGLVKPDIVFFGEQLPKAFEQQAYQTALADLVLIVGTSLTVYPFASLPDMAKPGKPRVLFNMERVGQLGARPDDVLELGSCDDGIRKLADELGWRDELEELWKGVVGEKEANRQLQSQATRKEEEEDEVRKLTAEVEAALKLDESDEEDRSDLDAMIRAHLSGNAETTAADAKESNEAHKPPQAEEVPSKTDEAAKKESDDGVEKTSVAQTLSKDEPDASKEQTNPPAKHEEKVPESKDDTVQSAASQLEKGDAETRQDSAVLEKEKEKEENKGDVIDKLLQ